MLQTKCKDLVDNKFKKILDGLSKKLTPDQICGDLHMC